MTPKSVTPQDAISEAVALPIVALDGRLMPAHEAAVSPLDRGFQTGDGVFETFWWLEGGLVDARRHLERLRDSAVFARFPLPDAWTAALLIAEIREVASRNGLGPGTPGEAAVRLTLTRGVPGAASPTRFVHLRHISPSHIEKRRSGALLVAVPGLGRGATLGRHKTTSYLASTLAMARVRERTSDRRAEGLFVTPDGEVLEGTSSNVFVWTGKTLVTPEVDAGVLPGTSRRALLEAADALGVPCEIRALRLEELRDAEEACITSSTLPLAPVVAVIDGDASSASTAPVGTGTPGPVFRRLADALWERARQGGDGAWPVAQRGSTTTGE